MNEIAPTPQIEENAEELAGAHPLFAQAPRSVEFNKLRKRLGWEAGLLNGNGGRPKGMHWETYERLERRHDALVQVSLHDIGRKLGFLHKLLEG